MLSANCRNWGPHIYPFKILCFRTRISRIVSVDFVGCWRGELDQISGWFRCEWYEDGGRLRRNHFITSAPSSSHPFNDQPHFFFWGPKMNNCIHDQIPVVALGWLLLDGAWQILTERLQTWNCARMNSNMQLDSTILKGLYIRNWPSTWGSKKRNLSNEFRMFFGVGP